MSDERASIFGEDADLDVSAFKPKPATKPAEKPGVRREQVRAVSEAASFRSREPKPATAPVAMIAPPRREPRRHRTGRNVQLNIKATAEAVEAFYAITDHESWVLGETFERAIQALQRELNSQK
jgi:hypothetical protein